MRRNMQVRRGVLFGMGCSVCVYVFFFPFHFVQFDRVYLFSSVAM